MLQNLYDLWQAECFCDVEIVCDGEVFKVKIVKNNTQGLFGYH